MKKYFYFAIVSLVMFSCENEDLDEISSKANNTAKQCYNEFFIMRGNMKKERGKRGR